MLPVIALVALQSSQSSLDKYVYPLSRVVRAPRVVIDYSEVPTQKEWMEAAKRVATDWYPEIVRLLDTKKYRGPRQVKLVVKPDLPVPAWAVGSTITINGKWIAAHPDDLGMIVHELTHVVQSYPEYQGKPGWLVEGIADYVRWWRYEPEAPRSRIDPVKSRYTDSYRITAAWLAWAGHKYNLALVPALDGAMRRKEDPMPLFAQLTGKDADALWAEFVDRKSN